jgi:NitT/TauT family transport system permease protein
VKASGQQTLDHPGALSVAEAQVDDLVATHGERSGVDEDGLARRHRRRSRQVDGSLRLVAPLITAVVVAVLWQWWANRADSIMIAGFTETISAAWDLVTSGSFWSAAWHTCEAILLGFSISAVVGIVLGLLMGRLRTFERICDVYVNILLVTPMAAIVPVLIMATGLTLTTRVLVVILFSLPMVVVNTRAGVRGVAVVLVEMARCFGAGELHVLRRIVIPGAAPGIVTGLRLGLARAITASIVVELLLVPVGLGGLILDFRGQFRADDLYATVLLIVVLSLMLLQILKWLERAVFPWARPTDAVRS